MVAKGDQITCWTRTDRKRAYVSDRPLYLVLTKDMANWIPSISKIGNWDIIKGKPKGLTGMPSTYQLIYENLSCEASDQANRIYM